jgi:hypothetical protein
MRRVVYIGFLVISMLVGIAVTRELLCAAPTAQANGTNSIFLPLVMKSGFTCGEDPVPPGGPCPAICSACANGHCIIECTTPHECASASLICPIGFSCEVQCDSMQACEGGAVVCPDDYSCEVQCTDVEACKYLDIDCSSNGTCSLYCASMACENTVLNCGANACTLGCEGTCNPGGASVNCGDSCDCNIP